MVHTKREPGGSPPKGGGAIAILFAKQKNGAIKNEKVIVTRPTYAFMYELRNGVYRRNAKMKKMKKNNELKYFSSLKIHRKKLKTDKSPCIKCIIRILAVP